MHEYDTTLKAVLRRLTSDFMRQLTGVDDIVRWHNVELPEVRSSRVDMLGETTDGGLVHIELQSKNNHDMALRMLEYATGIRRAYGRFPAQVVLYTGSGPLHISGRIEEPGVRFHCRIVDIREMDGEALLASPQLEDNIVAVLAGLGDARDAVRRILSRIAASEPGWRGVAIKELEILAGLMDLEEIVQGVPILNDFSGIRYSDRPAGPDCSRGPRTASGRRAEVGSPTDREALRRNAGLCRGATGRDVG